MLGLRDTLGKDSGVLVLEEDISWGIVEIEHRITYGSILGTLSITTLECESMTLVLETLWGDQTLDLWCLGVDLLALTLWLNLTTDNEFTDLTHFISISLWIYFSHSISQAPAEAVERDGR